MSVDNQKKDVFNLDCDIAFDDLEDFNARIDEIKKSSSSYMNKNKRPEFTSRTFGGEPLINPNLNDKKPNDISPNQQNMFGDEDMISDHKIEDYVLGLACSPMNWNAPSLEQAFQKIDMMERDKIHLWMDDIIDNIYEVFDFAFPNTVHVVEDILEKCVEILEPHVQHFESAMMMHTYMTELYIEYEDGSQVQSVQ
jgi:hypothetical protein